MGTEERRKLLERIFLQLRMDGKIRTQSDLAEAINMQQSNISKALNGDERYLTDTIFKRITNKFGRVLVENIDTNDSDELKTPVRYWVDSSATAGGRELYEDSQSDEHEEIMVPGFSDCTDAVNLFGDSMSPLFQSGEIIMLRPWTDNWIDYGHIYLIITTSGYRMVKYVKKGMDEEHVLCVSENKEYEDFQIPKKDIYKLYLVKGAISRFTM